MLCHNPLLGTNNLPKHHSMKKLYYVPLLITPNVEVKVSTQNRNVTLFVQNENVTFNRLDLFLDD